MNKYIVLLASMVLVSTACGSKNGSTPSSSLVGGGTEEDNGGGGGGGGGGTPAPSKAMLEVWQNGVWGPNLTTPGANLSGTPFQLVAKHYVDNSEVHCPATVFMGTNASGTWTTNNCTATGGNATNIILTFNQLGGTGTYTNDGTTLHLCKSNGSCQDYQ